MSKKIDRTGEIAYSNNGEKMVIIRYDNKNDIDVQFDDGTIVEHKQYNNFLKGKIKNPFSPTVYGIGFIGKGRFKSKDENGKETKCYKMWLDMLRRCYCSKLQEKFPTYKGCTVCPEWWNFQNFAKWYYSHFYEVGNEKMALDKDILKKGNKIYSAETCIFVPTSINVLFVKGDNKRGDYPIGVLKEGNKFRASLSKGNGKAIHLGSFSTPNEAYQVYKKHKEEYIKEVAEKYKSQIPHELYEAMINYEVEIDD